MTLRTLNYGNYGIFLKMGNEDFVHQPYVLEDYLEHGLWRRMVGTTEEPSSTGMLPFVVLDGRSNSKCT